MIAFRDRGFAGLVGVGRVDITPPLEVFARCWGASNKDRMIGIHRPLTATALAFAERDNPNGSLVLVSLDGSWWQANDECRFRTELLERCALEDRQLMVSLTHTHAAPPLNTELTDRPGGAELADYIRELPGLIAPAIKKALEGLADGFVTAHWGRCDLARRRDFYTNANASPLIGLSPRDAADDTLLALRVCDRRGRAIAIVANYACHLTTLGFENTQMSPDLAGAFRETVEQAYPGALALFIQGASGDLAPAYQYHGQTEVADTYGRKLAYATLAAVSLGEGRPSQLRLGTPVQSAADLAMWRPEAIELNPSLASIRRDFPLRLKEDFPMEAELCLEMQLETDSAIRERLQRKLCLRRALGNDNPICANLWLWRLGDILLAGAPFEAYSKWQISVRREFPGSPIAIMNLVNGSPGYLPPQHAYDDPRLYSVWQTPFERGGLETLIKETTKGARELLNYEHNALI